MPRQPSCGHLGIQIAGGVGSPAKLRRRSQTSRWAGRCADREGENSSPGCQGFTCRDSGILHLGTASIARLQRAVTCSSRTVTNRASPCETAAAIRRVYPRATITGEMLDEGQLKNAPQVSERSGASQGDGTPLGRCASPACRAARLRLAELVTRFVTRTLCHLVIPGATGETRATPVRWSGETSAIRVRLCETTSVRRLRANS
jgi:hypothetical protein